MYCSRKSRKPRSAKRKGANPIKTRNIGKGRGRGIGQDLIDQDRGLEDLAHDLGKEGSLRRSHQESWIE